MSTYTPQIKHLIQMMQSHHAWFGTVAGAEAEKILKAYPLNSFLLRAGENDLHYFLSYVTNNGLVFHKSIRINADGYYPNGAVCCVPNKTYHTVERLISEFLGCREEDLRPLSREMAQVQGF